MKNMDSTVSLRQRARNQSSQSESLSLSESKLWFTGHTRSC